VVGQSTRKRMHHGNDVASRFLRVSPLEHRAVKQVDDSQFFCTVAQVRVIQIRLDENNSHDVTPLPIRNIVPRAIPAQLLEEDVLGSMEIQVAIGVGCHLYSLSPIHLLLIKDRTAYDEQVDFHRCPVVDDVGARSISDSTPERVRLSVELIAESIHEGLDVVLGDGDDKVHVQSGARLAAKRTCQRSADKVTESASLQGVRYRQSNLNGVCRQPQYPDNLEDSG
jgi:hypothetical protein